VGSVVGGRREGFAETFCPGVANDVYNRMEMLAKAKGKVDFDAAANVPKERQLAVCLVNALGTEVLQHSLPLMTFLALPFLGSVQFYVSIRDNDGFKDLVPRLEAPIRLKLLRVLELEDDASASSGETLPHFAKWMNTTWEYAANDGAP